MARAKVPAKYNPYITKAVNSVAFTVGTQATKTRIVSCQLKDQNGKNLAVRACLRGYISDASTGADVSTSAPTTALASGATGKLHPITTKMFQVVTDVAGLVTIPVTDSGTPTFYLVFVLPDGTLTVSGAVAIA